MHKIFFYRKRKARQISTSEGALPLPKICVISLLLTVLLIICISKDENWRVTQNQRVNEDPKTKKFKSRKRILKPNDSMVLNDDVIDDDSVTELSEYNENDAQRLLNNGWIPEGDIVKHYQFQKTQEQKTAFSKWNSSHRKRGEEKLIDKLEYKASLESYPLNMLEDFDKPLKESDVMFFWHIPKSGGSTMKAILSQCFNLTRSDLHIDLSTMIGISQAKKERVVDQNFLDVIVGSNFHETSALFSNDHKGRLITVMRHPVELVSSLFYYLGRKATWERHYNPELAKMTLLEYANSALMMDNWMTRYLSRKLHGELTEEDLSLAISILEKKAVIGMIDQMESSIQMFRKYFGLQEVPYRKKCIHRFVNKEHVNKNEYHKKLPRKSIEWKTLEERNSFDVQLYNHARTIFNKQKLLLKVP